MTFSKTTRAALARRFDFHFGKTSVAVIGDNAAAIIRPTSAVAETLVMSANAAEVPRLLKLPARIRVAVDSDTLATWAKSSRKVHDLRRLHGMIVNRALAQACLGLMQESPATMIETLPQLPGVRLTRGKSVAIIMCCLLGRGDKLGRPFRAGRKLP